MASPQVKRNNERKYHNTNSTYALPNDEVEHNRLETQSEHIRQLMNNQLIHSPLSSHNVQKALDIGCGTGIMTHRIASEFPNAQVYGLDLSPVPNIREKLPNIEYIQANIVDVTNPADPDARFKPSSFDYIFSRLLVLGMTNWPDYVSRCVALVKPGGWLEMHDLDFSAYRVPENATAEQREAIRPHALTLKEFQNESHPAEKWRAPGGWHETFAELCTNKGMDSQCGGKLLTWFMENGLEDVRVKRYVYSTSVWEGMTDLEKKFAQFHKDYSANDLMAAVRKLGQGQDAISQEKVEEAVAGVKKEVDDGWTSTRGFHFVYAVCGRKPAK